MVNIHAFHDYNYKKSTFYSEYKKVWFKLLSTSIVKNQGAMPKVFLKNELSPICTF